jgi:hypothetical protein
MCWRKRTMSEIVLKRLEEIRLENMKFKRSLSLIDISVKELKNLVNSGAMVTDLWTLQYLQKIVRSFDDIEFLSQKYYEKMKAELELERF